MTSFGRDMLAHDYGRPVMGRPFMEETNIRGRFLFFTSGCAYIESEDGSIYNVGIMSVKFLDKHGFQLP